MPLNGHPERNHPPMLNFIDTLGRISVPVIVLILGGLLALGLGWWMAVKTEGKDHILFGRDDNDETL